MTGASRAKRWLLRLTMVVGAGIAMLVAWLWLIFFSPWGYSPPADLQPIKEGTIHQVFVYGTLRQPVVRWLVIGRATPASSATLPNFRKQGLNLIPQPNAQTPGDVLVVDAEELRRLDRYERLGVRYERRMLTLEEGMTAWVYTRLSDNEP